MAQCLKHNFWEIGTNNVWDGTQAATGDTIGYQFTAPIDGWSSNARMSEDLGGREIVVSGTFSANQVIPDATSTLIQFNTAIVDTVGCFDTANNRVIIPESGFYDVSVRLRGPLSNGRHNVIARVNGVDVAGSTSTSQNTQYYTQTFAANGGVSGDIVVSKNGNVVTVDFGSLTHASLSSVSTGAGLLPTWARPSALSRNLYFQDSTGAREVEVSTAGTITWEYRDNAGSTIVKTATGNGFLTYTGNSDVPDAGTRLAGTCVNDILKLNKGDIVEFHAFQDTGASVTYASSSIYSAFAIAKRSSPQTMLETETVAARYTIVTGGQAIPNNTDTVIVYNERISDTHNAYNTTTGVYTIPVSGFYQMNANATLTLDVLTGYVLTLHFSLNGGLFQSNTMEFT